MSLARQALVAAACLAPLAAAAAAADFPRGRLALDLGIGPAQGGAPFVTLGAAIGVVDTPERRIDLRVRYAALATQDVRGGGDPFSDENTYNGTAVMFELVHAWRAGHFEPYLSVGFANLRGDLDVTVETVPSTEDRATGAFLGAGLRLPVGERTLLSMEGLYVVPARSDMTWLSPTPQLGGASLLFGLTWRLGVIEPSVGPRPIDVGPLVPAPAAPPVAAAPPPSKAPVPAQPAPAVAAEEPPPPEPPPRAPATAAPAGRRALACVSPEVPSFAIRVQQLFLCRENPVAGGFFCTPRAEESRLLDRAECERGCLRGGADCPSPRTANGAACTRCAAGCAEVQWLPCSGANGATLDGDACRVEAGRWGGAAEVTVPAECRPSSADPAPAPP